MCAKMACKRIGKMVPIQKKVQQAVVAFLHPWSMVIKFLKNWSRNPIETTQDFMTGLRGITAESTSDHPFHDPKTSQCYAKPFGQGAGKNKTKWNDKKLEKRLHVVDYLRKISPSKINKPPKKRFASGSVYAKCKFNIHI